MWVYLLTVDFLLQSVTVFHCVFDWSRHGKICLLLHNIWESCISCCCVSLGVRPDRVRGGRQKYPKRTDYVPTTPVAFVQRSGKPVTSSGQMKKLNGNGRRITLSAIHCPARATHWPAIHWPTLPCTLQHLPFTDQNLPSTDQHLPSTDQHLPSTDNRSELSENKLNLEFW